MSMHPLHSTGKRKRKEREENERKGKERKEVASRKGTDRTEWILLSSHKQKHNIDRYPFTELLCPEILVSFFFFVTIVPFYLS